MNYLRETAKRKLIHYGFSENKVEQPPFTFPSHVRAQTTAQKGRKTGVKTVGVVLKPHTLSIKQY